MSEIVTEISSNAPRARAPGFCRLQPSSYRACKTEILKLVTCPPRLLHLLQHKRWQDMFTNTCLLDLNIIYVDSCTSTKLPYSHLQSARCLVFWSLNSLDFLSKCCTRIEEIASGSGAGVGAVSCLSIDSS